MKWWWGVVATAALSIIVLPFVMLALYLKIENAPQGSFLYHTGIPDHLKAIPVIAPCGEAPLYSFEGRDGERIAFGDVRYETRLAVEEAKTAVSEEMVNLGCALTDVYDDGHKFHCGAYLSVNSRVTIGGACRQVSFSIAGEGPFPSNR